MVVGFTRRSGLAALGVALTLVVAVGALGWLLITGRITMVAAAAAAVTMLMLGTQVQRMAGSLGNLREEAQQVADVEVTTAVIDTGLPDQPSAGALQCLRAESVDFRYPAAETNALTGIDLAIRAGEMVAIVGVNDSGKTTLAKLLCGLYEPAALDGGADLSLGQWQRVAIARVLYRDPSLVVLDEPTASLDAQAEADLFATLEKLRQGRTFIVISHRFSTVRTADRIIVIDAGRIAEQGTHNELMALNGQYASMYSVQASSYQPS